MDGAMKSKLWSCETLERGLNYLEKQKVDVKNEKYDIDQELNVPLVAKDISLLPESSRSLFTSPLPYRHAQGNSATST